MRGGATARSAASKRKQGRSSAVTSSYRKIKNRVYDRKAVRAAIESGATVIEKPTLPIAPPAAPLPLRSEAQNIISNTAGRLGVAALDIDTISKIFDATIGIPDIQRWETRLYYYGNVNDTMIARGGDLVHDIGSAVNVAIPRGVSMIDFIGTYSPAAAATVSTYITRIPQILRDLNDFRRVKYPPKTYKWDKISLAYLTSELRRKGVGYIVYDAGFGNIFKDGFGTGMTYIKSAASEVDGASKFRDETLRRLGISVNTEYTPFSLPYFYGSTINHTISFDGAIRRVTIGLNPAGAAPQQAVVQCVSGISVNAICNSVSIPAPRGSGEAGSPVTFAGNIAVNQENHVVFVKTMTDWAQLAYALLLKEMGIKCVFITNDEYCLALGAALGVPYMIRTPYTGCEFVELYEVDPTDIELTASEREAILAKLSVLTEDQQSIIRNKKHNFNQRIDRAIGCMRMNHVPESIITAFIMDYITAGAEMNTIYSTIGTAIANKERLTNPELVNFRPLITMSIDNYIQEQITRRLVAIHTKYVAFGVTMQTELHTKITTDTDTISRVINLIRGIVGDELPNIMDVIGRIAGGGVAISVRDDGATGAWEKYYSYYIGQVLGPDAKAQYDSIDRGFRNWDNQSSSLKLAMWEIVRDLHVSIKQPGSKLCYPDKIEAGAAEAFVQAGGDGSNTISLSDDYLPDSTFPIDDDIRDYIQQEIDSIMSIPSDAVFKPSCSKINVILSTIPTHFENTAEKIHWIIDALKELQIDAYESNMAQEFEILMSDLDDIYEMMNTDEITSTEMREQLEVVIFLHDVFISLFDGISPDNQRNLIAVIQSIDTAGQTVDGPAAAANLPATTGQTLGSSAALNKDLYIPLTATIPAGYRDTGIKRKTPRTSDWYKLITRESPSGTSVVTVPLSVRVGRGGARKSRRYRRSSPRHPRRITHRKKRASHMRHTIRRRK